MGVIILDTPASYIDRGVVLRYHLSMEQTRDKRTRRIIEGKDAKIPADVHKRAARKLLVTINARSLNDFNLPSMKLKKLSGNRAGQHSIRVNNQWRICFVWTGNRAEQIEFCDYH